MKIINNILLVEKNAKKEIEKTQKKCDLALKEIIENNSNNEKARIQEAKDDLKKIIESKELELKNNFEKIEKKTTSEVDRLENLSNKKIDATIKKILAKITVN